MEEPRTSQQNKALWKYFSLLAEAFNDAGKDMRVILKPEISIPWTKDSVHDHIWIPIQKAMYSTDSTTELTKIEQIEKIHKVISRELGEKHGIEYLPFPTDNPPQND